MWWEMEGRGDSLWSMEPTGPGGKKTWKKGRIEVLGQGLCVINALKERGLTCSPFSLCSQALACLCWCHSATADSVQWQHSLLSRC